MNTKPKITELLWQTQSWYDSKAPGARSRDRFRARASVQDCTLKNFTQDLLKFTQDLTFFFLKRKFPPCPQLCFTRRLCYCFSLSSTGTPTRVVSAWLTKVHCFLATMPWAWLTDQKTSGIFMHLRIHNHWTKIKNNQNLWLPSLNPSLCALTRLQSHAPPSLLSILLCLVLITEGAPYQPYQRWKHPYTVLSYSL